MITPPRLRNDCFALPAGVDWVPVDAALERLRNSLTTVVGKEQVSITECDGRILADNVQARRANPPAPNSAVDGYGFAGDVAEGVAEFPLVEGCAAAGVPFDGALPKGHAIRILTGAILPVGVETVVLQEDTTREGNRIALRGPLKAGANTRRAGEDVVAGDVLMSAGHRLRPQDIALLAATGVSTVRAHRRLRVGVLSTGDEVVTPGGAAPEALPLSAIYDANRPMLLAQLRRWGFDAVDLGIAPDDRDQLRAVLDEAATNVDAILTSGGASTGDEDHMSALIGSEGHMQAWRIAIKPGRPLALGTWSGVPVFGLPGNPVAALVCTLLFARPALERLAGGVWERPTGFEVPAAFSKSKKPGRAEYLRARLRPDGTVETFASEGSGRISGLVWATGLVELEAPACEITPGSRVRFIPYASFD